jgi:hypothetical protein
VRLLHVVEVAADLDVDLSDRDVELGAPIIERADSWPRGRRGLGTSF